MVVYHRVKLLDWSTISHLSHATLVYSIITDEYPSNNSSSFLPVILSHNYRRHAHMMLLGPAFAVSLKMSKLAIILCLVSSYTGSTTG